MKSLFNFILKPLACFAMILAAINANAQFYFINFEGDGAANHVDSVRVHNITQETMLMMDGNDTLFLFGTVGSHIPEFNNDPEFQVFPNPSDGEIRVSFGTSQEEKFALHVYDISGRMIAGRIELLSPGAHVYTITGLGAGTYTVSARSERISFTEKIISTGHSSGAVGIQRIGSQEKLQANQLKSGRAVVHMQYNHDDLLLFTCYADNYAVVIPHVAIESTTITADFLPCTDGDGNHYPIVYIGSQIWMARNLATTKYRDGSDIPHVTVGSSWNQLTTGAYCWYGNNVAYKPVYGALYNWYATNPATNGNNDLCPEGWRVPSDADYLELTNYLSGGTTNGGRLKETGFAHWNSPNTGATNERGFTALPGGWRGWNANFQSMNTYCYLWTASEQQGNFAYLRNMFHNSANIGRGTVNKSHGLSIRCLKDQ